MAKKIIKVERVQEHKGDIELVKKTSFTEWFNDTDQDIYMKFFVCNGFKKGLGVNAPVTCAQFYEVTIPPGQSEVIDSKYDDAIRKVKSGKVVGGQAPQLKVKNGPNYPLHTAIDVNYSSQEARFKASAKILEEKRLNDQAFTIATAEHMQNVEKAKKSKEVSK
jgi:hypothetical protein